jgi:hypothetical protein
LFAKRQKTQFLFCGPGATCLRASTDLRQGRKSGTRVRSELNSKNFISENQQLSTAKSDEKIG